MISNKIKKSFLKPQAYAEHDNNLKKVIRPIYKMFLKYVPAKSALKSYQPNYKKGAKWFRDNVKKLYGFYQTTEGEMQTGSPLFYEKSKKDDFNSEIPSEHDGAYNIHVSETLFNKDTIKPDDTNGSYILDHETTHSGIDEEDELLELVRKLVNNELK